LLRGKKNKRGQKSYKGFFWKKKMAQNNHILGEFKP
jgi:hypothetical protein